MAEEKKAPDLNALKTIKAQQDRLAAEAKEKPTVAVNDAPAMEEKQSAGQGTQQPVEVNTEVDYDPIEDARDEAKIRAGVVPAPEGRSHDYKEVVQTFHDGFNEKLNRVRSKFEQQQKEAFGHINAGDRPKVVEAQRGDSPKDVNAVVPEAGPGGPSNATSGNAPKATAQGATANVK